MLHLHHVSGLPSCEALLAGLDYVSNLLYRDPNLVGFHGSFKYQIKHHIFLEPTRKERINSLDYKLAEILLHVKTVLYINNICSVYCLDIYFF